MSINLYSLLDLATQLKHRFLLRSAPQGVVDAMRLKASASYKNVQGMTRNRDGSWSGKALRGGAMVDVHVDARGNVVTK